MRRSAIEQLEKVIVKPAARIRDLRIYTPGLEEVPDILEFSLHFDSQWKHALLWIAVTDENGNLVLESPEKDPFGPKRVKTLKKRVNFDFMESD